MQTFAALTAFVGFVLGLALFIKTRRFGPTFVILIMTAVCVGIASPAVFAFGAIYVGKLVGTLTQRIGSLIGFDHGLPPAIPGLPPEVPAAPVTPNAPQQALPGWALTVAIVVVALLLVAAVVVLIVRKRHDIAARVDASKARRAAAEAARQATRSAWESLKGRYYKVVEAHAEHEADILAVFAYPTLTDLSEPTTQRLYEALGVAQTHLSQSLPGQDQQDRFTSAVAALEVAYLAAVRYAEKTRLSKFAPGERKRISQAHALLTQALDSGVGPAERQTFYAKAMGLLDGLVVVPAPAAEALTVGARLALPSAAAVG